ncbi:MAG: MarR family transcriptional regulator [Candidatus Omnitrophota bacterium]
MNNYKKPEEIRDRFIGEIGRLGESIGLNRTICQMYALLYLEEGPLSLTELSRMLHISKGSASLNIRKLEEWGAVKSIWRKGSTQNYYQGNRDLWDIAKSRINSGLKKRLDLIDEGIAELDEVVKPNGKISAGELKMRKAYSRRFGEIKDFSRKTRQLLDIFQ